MSDIDQAKQLSRAVYIMKLNGINVNEEETITDPGLLMEISRSTHAQEKLKQCSDSFVEAFQGQRFDEAVKCIQRMTYYERACEEILKKL